MHLLTFAFVIYDTNVSQVGIDALDGETLVPNSPIPDSPVMDDQDDLDSLVDNDDHVIDKRGNPLACIFVASLNKYKTEEALNVSVYRKFEEWGKLLHVKAFKDGQDRPYAFVQYERIGDAKQALLMAPGTLLDGRNIRCEPARVNRSLIIESTEIPLAEQDIVNELSTYGPIEQFQFIEDGSLTSARVMFSYRDDAINAFLKLQVLGSLRHWKVEWTANNNSSVSGDGKNDYKNTRIYVGNLGKSVGKSEIQERFGEYGPIESIQIINKTMSKSRNTMFGFIKYTTRNSATMAISAEVRLDGQQWYGRTLRVSHQEDRRKGFADYSLNVHDVVATTDSHTEDFDLRRHSPGVANTSTYSTYRQLQYQPHLTNQFTKKFAMSGSSTTLATTTMSTTNIPNFNTGTHRHQELQENQTIARTASNMDDSPDRLNDSPTDAETQPNHRPIQSTYELQYNEDTETVMEQTSQDYTVDHFPIHGCYYYWYPPNLYSQVYPSIYPQTSLTYDRRGSYYQMCPYAGTYYFIPIAEPFVPYVSGPSSNTKIQPPPQVLHPTLQPIHYPLTTSPPP
ncbi:unnamed protein product [Absidia cylindrospora]